MNDPDKLTLTPFMNFISEEILQDEGEICVLDFSVSKYRLGRELEEELAKGYDLVKISRLGFRHFFNNIDTLEPDLYDILKRLSLMEEDAQFVLTKYEVQSIANQLLKEGEEEEFSILDPTIKEVAEDLGGHWLMCPLCHESWENHIKYPMVRCPKCSQNLRNSHAVILKWCVILNNRRYEIPYFPALGYYLHVFEKDVRIHAYLQETKEAAIDYAWHEFEVCKDLWKFNPLACRVCGMTQGDFPWGEDGMCCTFDICDCCGTTFGYQDCTIKSVNSYRELWFEGGAVWAHPKEEPPHWSLEEQMKNILLNEQVIKLTWDELWPLLNVVGEICYGLDVDFETVIGVKSEAVIDLMKKISKEKKIPEVILILSDSELDILKRSIDEVIRQIEEWEFQTRVGVSINEVMGIKKKIGKE